MANVVYELMAVLGLDSKPFEDGLKGAESTATGGGSKIGKALGGAAKAAGAAVAAASTAVVAFSKSSVDAGMQFDTAMSQVAATMGKTVEEMTQEVGTADTAYGEFSGNLRDFAQFLGANTAFSATQAAEALNYMALAGYDVQQSMDMLPNVLSLAAAGNFDLARASDMVTDAQTAFGISAERTSQMVDEMAKAASTGNTSVEQLGDAFLVVGGLAQELNGGIVTMTDGTQQSVDGLQELEIALTAMANAGVKGSEAGTHMRNMLLKLSSPTDEGAVQFEKLGVSVFDAEGNMRSLQDVFGDLSTALGQLTQEEKIQAISDLFNVRDMASAEALLNAVGQDWDHIGESILAAQGSAAQMAETQLDNLAGDMTLFQSALEGAKIAISDSLTPTLRQFVEYGTEAVSQLGTAFKENGLEGAIEVLGPIIDQGIAMLFDVLPRVIEAGVALLDALVTAIITNLPKLVPAAVQIITQLVDSFSKNADKMVDAAVEIIFALADGLINALPKLIPAVVKIILAIVEKLTEPETLLKLIDASIQIIGAIGKGLIEAVPDLLKSAAVVLANLVKYFIDYLPQLAESGGKMMQALGEGIADAASAVWDSIKEVVKGIWDTITETIQAAKEWGSDLLQNFMGGVTSKGAALLEKVKGVAQSIRDLIGFSEPKKGPLANFHTFAPDMMELFAKGIKDNEGLLTAQIEKSFNFGGGLMGATPALAAGPTTNTWNITVNGIEELDEIVNWYQGRQVAERMR